MPFKKRILTIGLLVAAITLHAQPLFSDIAVTAITPAQGLSQASNYFRHEDGLGFMWLTGNNALNRYDGSAIKVYNLRKYFIDCDVLKQGYGFAEDADHNVYVGSIAGLYIYHRSKDRFTLQKIFMAGMDSSAMPFAFKDDKIWCFNRNYQLATYHVRTKAVEQVGQLPLPPISSLHIYGISFSPFYYRMPLMDEQGTIWATGTEKVVAFDTRTGRTTEPFAAFLQSQNISITCCCYRKGLLTCGTTHGLLLLNLPQGKAQHIKTIARQPLGFINGIGCTDSLIALRWNYSQLALVSINEMRIQLVTQLTDVQLNKLFNLSFDRSGRLWACNDGIELLVLDFSGRLLHKEPGSRLPVSHPLNKGCHTFAELPNGHVVIKCEYLFDRQQNQFVRLPFILPDDAATKRACTDFFRKGVWFFYDQPWDEIVTPSRAMYFYGAQGLRTIAIKPHANNPIKQQQDMVALPNGRLLCSFGEGLFWWLPDSQQLRKASGATAPNAFKINPLSNNRVAVSYLDDNMYVYRVMPNNDLQLLQTVMPGVVTFYLQQDSMHQRYWAGTDRGVFLLNEQLQPLQHFEAGNGLAGTKIYGLLLDNDGNVYCSHERGLSYINARTLQIINLGMEDGIQDFDFHNRSFLKTADGTLFFGGTRGFNWFKPPFRFQSFYQPEVYVDELLVNNRPYRNDTNAHYLQALYLDDANNDISIRAVVKDLAYSSGYRLVYRFAGQDTTWKEVPFNGPLNFNRLAPGSYTLQLGIYNKYTAGYRLQKSIHIVIEAPFYRRAWFWALMAIAGTASALWWVYRRKLARQKERFLQQLALEKQRLRITADLHDEIGASLSSLQINSAVAGQLLGKDNEGAQKVLHKIESQAHKLATAIGDIIWSMKPGKEEFMTLSTKIKQFAGEMLEPSNIQFSIDIPTEIDKGLTDIALRKNLLLILKEAINNAAKYSRASQLQIGLHLQNGQIALRVADNGIGFDPQGVKGNGLGNMRHRATELGGTLSVQSAPGKGTVIMAQMPAVP